MTAPAIFDFDPPVGTTLPSKSHRIKFKVTDDVLLRRVMIIARFPTKLIEEVVHDGDSFGPMYSNGTNSRSNITGGFQYQTLRDGGWPADPDFKAIAIDAVGNETVF